MSISISIRRACTLAGVFLCFLAFTAGHIGWATGLKREPARVLVLHPSSGPNLRYAEKIRAELYQQSPHPIEIYDASYVPRLADDDAVADRYGDYLGAIVRDRNFDLGVAVGGASVHLYNRLRHRLFSKIPFLAIAEQRQLAEPKSPAMETTIATTIEFSAVVEHILRILPGTSQVAVVIGDSPVERYWLEQMRAAVEPFKGRIAFTWLNEFPVEQILDHVATLPPRSAILFSLMLSDITGFTQEEDNVFSKLHKVANAPIFSYYDAQFGKGIVGGPMISVQEKSRAAASVAVRILGGESPGDIKIPPIGFSAAKYDWREMQRWGINGARLPAGSEINFQPVSAWAQYRVQILSACAAILLQAALIVWLVYEHRYRHRAEILARNAMSELTQMNRVATAGELSASIAHEVNQPLTGMATRASAALRWLGAEKPDLEKVRAALTHIVSASHRASDIVTSVRAMFRKETNDRMPLDMNLVILAVLSILRIELGKNNVVLSTALNRQIAPVEGDQVQLQQVILNLVMNAIESMHSSRRRELRIRSDVGEPGTVYVSIEDTGPGIEPSNLTRIFKPLFTTKSRGMGMGLAICQSIIESHHGRIWASQGIRGGANFQFELPCYSASRAQPEPKTSVIQQPASFVHDKASIERIA